MTAALLCLDLVKEFLHPEGKLSEDFVKFEEEHKVLHRIARIQDQFRQQGDLVIHARTQFSEGHPEWCPQCKMYRYAKRENALLRHTFGTEFMEDVAPHPTDPVITKHRVSPFFHTRLEIILDSKGVEDLYICGLSSLGAVTSAAREGHDHNYNVVVLKDACIGQNTKQHTLAMDALEPFVDVHNFADVAVRLTV